MYCYHSLYSTKVKRSELFFSLLLVPSFKLLSFAMFQEQNFHKSFFSAVEFGYDFLRVIVSTMGYIYLFQTIGEGRRISEVTKLLIFMFMAQILSCILNKSIDLFFLVKTYSYVGVILVCDRMNKKLTEGILHANTFFFKMLTLFGLISIFLFPLGILRADRVYTATYFLGGKNASFPFYYMFLFGWYMSSIIKTKKLPIFWFLPLVFMIAAAIICQSVNSLISLLLIGAICILYSYIKPMIKTEIMFGIFAFLMASIYAGINIPGLSGFLSVFGRNTTFSKRTFLWKQAVEHIIRSPIYGAGYKITYNLWSEITDHAHGWYIDSLAKYGLMSFVPFVFVVLCTIKNINRIRNGKVATFVGMMVLVYLLHMGFDDYNFNFFLLIIMIVDGAADTKKPAALTNDREGKTYELKKV